MTLIPALAYALLALLACLSLYSLADSGLRWWDAWGTLR